MILQPYVGNSIERHIKRYYTGYEKLAKPDKQKLVNYAIQYMFRIIPATKFASLFRTVCKDSTLRVIELRRDLLKSGYFLKNLKLGLYYWVANGTRMTQALQKQFKFRQCDQKLHTWLTEDTLRELQRFSKKGFKAKTLEQLDEALTYVLSEKEVRTFATKFVYRKMRFIFQTHGQQPDDIVLHLLTEALQTSMFYYPQIETMEHLTNIMKRTIHNQGINYIDTFTTEIRGRLKTDANGETVRVVLPMCSPEVQEFLATDENASVVTHLDGEAYDTLATKLSVQRVLSQYTGKRQHFLRLISGEYCEHFSEYLKRTRKLTSDNDAYFDRVDFEVYVNHALDFLAVGREAGQRFVSELRTKLASVSDAEAA